MDEPVTHYAVKQCVASPGVTDKAALRAAYQSTILKLATAVQSCSECHKANQSPLFVGSDTALAFEAALPFLSKSNSAMEFRARNGHCPNCTDSTAMKAAILEFYTLAESGAVVCKTPAVPVPAPAIRPNPSNSVLPQTSNSPNPIMTTSVGQATYDANCKRCHKLGTYDASGSPNLSGKGSAVSGKYTASGSGHKSITLTQAQIDGLKTFLNST